nr:protein kinase [Kineococcus aurantiacus]
MGTGGVGTVHRVRDTASGALLAWKVWHEPLGEQDHRRFEAECALHTALSGHPHVVRLVGHARPGPGERPWITTELHETSLQDWLTAHRPTAAQWHVLVADLLSGLGAVHAVGHVHRDVKPANVLLRAGRWSLTDLGLVMPVDGTTRNPPAGTPYYLAPELGRPGIMPGPRSDVYSAALTLLLVHDRLADPGGLPPAVEQVLTRAASVHPADRPADAQDLHRRLVAAAAGHVPAPAAVTAAPVPTAPAGTVSRVRREARLSGLGAALAVCLVLGGSAAAPTTATDPTASPAGCPVATTVDAVVPGRGPGLAEVSHLGYTVHGHISLEVSGRVAPELAGSTPGPLWIVSFPRRLPVGRDGRPGSLTWYPLGVVRPDGDGCFQTDPLQLSSYDAAQGIVFDVALARLSPQRQQEAAAWLAENSADGWRTLPADVEPLSTFVVDSGPFEVL